MDENPYPDGSEEVQEQVAIIGMAGRFPGAGNLDEFWRNLRDGVDSVRDLTEEELLASGVDPALFTRPDYVKAAAPIDGVELFDASFFGFSPREAELLDPQARVFLECAWEALESAGYVAEAYDGWIGLFAGVSLPAYLMSNLIPNRELAAQVGNFQLMLTNDRDYFTTRVSYKLGLQGPSVNVQTACSTSLVATHLACQSLLSYHCGIALAGGVRINFPQLVGYPAQEGSIFSPDGRCRAFDADGRGALFGEGAGVVVLKRLSEAVADGDTIHAVIRGSAYNNDGLDKVGYTAPSVNGQAKVIALAQAVAGVSPESLGYIEAHGSGTPLGDPIEVAALTRAFRAHTAARRFCAIGSVKTNVGHLEAAAGIAGLLKTVLALKHRTLPPSLHFETPNPEIDFEDSPFYVNTATREWTSDGAPRRAGVSSFGMGGTNAHAVLEEAPVAATGSASRPWQLLLLSARTPTALVTSAARLAAFLREHPETGFADAVHTLQAGRRSFRHRLALVCRDREDALAVLESSDPRRLLRSEQENADRPVTFLFPGLGEHYPGMALGLYGGEPAFRAALDECCDLLAPHLGLDLRNLLFPQGAGAGAASAGVDLKAMLGREERPASELDRTLYAQPAVFAVEYALAALLLEWGIRPQSLIGYSLGEYVAACLAGVLSLPDALTLVARRARLIDGLPAGAMLAVPLSEEETRARLGDELSVAALNVPSVSVVSGPEAAIADLGRRLAGHGLAGRRLPTTHAFHSSMMEPIRGAFADLVGSVRLAAPRIPYISNVTGTWITPQDATDPGYWVRHLCQTVRFADGLAELSREPERVLLEVGPGQGLTTFALQAAGGLVAVPTLRSSWDRQPDTAFLLTALAKLWLAGLRVDWTGFYAHERRQRVPLPTYPFERRRYFIDPPGTGVPRAETPPEETAEEPRPEARHTRPAHLRQAYVPPTTDLERRLAPLWQEVLGLETIGVHDSFFELGGHSLLAPQLLVRLRRDLGIDFAMRDFVETPTIARMAEAVELLQREGLAALAARREEVDLWAEASFLDPAVAPEAPWTGAVAEPAGIFLTGATGFLGSHILAELLGRTRARLHCLVRAADAASAFRRLRAALEERELWRDGMAGRIAAVPGDLAEPRFGLSEEAFRELAGRVDLVYHCGAWVNFNYPYGLLKPANVLGTVEALRVAAVGRAKPVHFISSIAATPEGDYGFRDHPVVYEDADSDSTQGLFGGYGETKWVCERLIRIARSRGLPVTIYRPGVLSGHSRTGIGNTRDMVWSLIKSCIQMGVHPVDEYRLDVTPVDYVASAIVHLSLDAGNADRLFQLPHPHPPTYRRVYEMVRAYGYPMEPLPFREWIDRVIEVARVDSGNALAPFAGVAENYDKLAEKARTEGEDGRIKDIVFDGTNTRTGLAGSGIVCPDLDEELIARYLDSFVRTGFYPPPPVEASAPASFAQRRLWFLARFDPGSAAYNLPFAVRLAGRLDAAVLARALSEIGRRHEPLRTTFRETGGEPVQVIRKPAPVPLPLVDLSGLPPARRRPEALRLAAAEAARPFDLERGPLFRPLLLRVGDAEHVASLTMHHIVTDGWSMGVLLREIAALYPAFAAGLPSPLPEPPVRYADFAAGQRRWLEGPEPAERLAYWRNRLAGAPVLELPTDRPRPAVRRGRGALEPLALSSELVLPLRELARGQGATLYMALVAAFQTLLHRYTRQEDLVVGSPVAGRDRPEVQDLIGFFINAVALRGRVDGPEGFRALLERTRGVCLEAWARQDLPFEKLVEEIQPERSLARPPLFQVVLSLEERPTAVRLAGLEAQALTLDPGAAKFDLTLMLAERDGRIDGLAELDTDLFDVPTIRRLIGHFRNLIAGAAADPERPVAELPMLDEAERHQVAAEAAAREKMGGDLLLPDLFAAQAARRPEAVALSFAGGSVTYGELARRAAGLARRLRDLGVGPEVPVALWCEREPGLVVAALGVLAAGGAYVPLDPSWPAERISLVLEDSGARLLVRGPGTAPPQVPPGVEVIELGEDVGEGFPASGATPDNTAYVIFTSGSTGRPKGVAVTHRNVARLLEAAEPWFGFGEGDVWTLFHSYAFDFSVWEMWGALAHGGRLVIVPWEVSRSPGAFAELLERERVTVLNQTPSAFYGLVDLERRLASLSWVVFGGEALDAGRLAPWWERHAVGRPRLANMYGITETTVHVTFRRVGPEDAWGGAGSAIGRPLPDLAVHVLEPGLDSAPLGVPGELAVGGAGVARGYLGRPDLTAERFIPDLFAGEPGARLYRSGDLGRLRPSGELEYLGRIDRQVKVRGFRIEPGEIEAALLRHPAVAEAAVVLRGDLPGGRGLAAFCVAPGLKVPRELRAFLQGRLPEPLVPAVFVLLDRLPLTPNGKVDRRALETGPLAAAGTSAGEPSAPPRTPAEELLAGIWTELLGLDRVGSDDDFFALGGHSLLATQLVSRIRETFGVELPLRAVFEAPTLAALAQAIPRESGEEPPPPIVPVPRDGDLPLSFAQQRLWFIDRLVPGNPFYVMAFGLRLAGPLHVEALREALREVGRRHESLRTTFRTVAGEPWQVVSERVDLELPVVDLAGLGPARCEETLRILGREEARRPFDLQRGPLLRGLLARLGREDHALLLHLHHVVSDGWSMGVLRRELSALYEAFADGRPSPLPELPIQYADFAVWQRRWLSGEALERQLAFWRRQLAGAPPVLDLPFDRPRPAVETFRGGIAEFSLPDALVRRLRALGRSLGTTLSMTALAGFDLLLARYARREDVVVGSAVANRNRREIEGLIGFFVNVLVLRTDLSGDPPFAELAARVREMSLAAYAHQDLPFEKLVEELQLPRDLAHHPLCQVMVGFQNFPRHQAQVRGLTITVLEGEIAETGTAKADLTLFLAEDGDGLRGWTEYNADLFEAPTVLRLQRHLVTLLEAAAGAPERPIGTLSMLTPEERHQMVREWSACGPEPALEPLLPARIAARVQETPDALALVSGQATLSYADLHRRAGRLARRLRQAGVEPEVRVGICLDRPDAMVEAVLGVLFAGGAWVPLDPAYPAARLGFMLEDAGCDLLVTTADLLARLPAEILPAVLLWEEAGGEGEAPPLPALLPENLAYLIYTSGSTGQPKGVAVTHGSLARVAGALARTYGVRPGDRVLQMLSPSFDVFVSEITNALGSGAALHVASRDERLPGPPLAALLRERAITVLGLSPSMLAALEPGDVPALRTVMLGGETCPPGLAARWLPGRRLFTAYGPTEATITCTAGRIEAGERPVLGWPLEGARIHLLDACLEPVPAGVPGEMFIAGEGLARGYHGRPDLTAERFLPDPFGPPGSRAYRTGDLARRHASGRLEFLGRVDDQVKLRGFRVEPGEAEARLAAHPEVESAVVLARNGSLVAWVVPRRTAREEEGGEEQVETWQRLYEEIYAREQDAADPDADLVGWNSSFTGEPIPAAEMREWVDATVEEILELRPSRVLEIGCGTGLLLRRIAPRCSLYVGTDFSQAALEGLERRLAGSLPQVRLEQRAADDFAGLPERAFDVVVLNSVVQYFPSADYLVEVLEKAAGVVADGGAVFLGDVRSLPLAEDFYLAVETFKADPSTSEGELRMRAAARRLQESELLVHPDLFHALRRRLARVRGVEVRAKRGKADNELNRYRYQVVLHVGEGGEAAVSADGPWSRWANDPLLGRTSRRLVPKLRAWAQEALPEFLVPSAIVVLDSLPRTPTGKVDRRALPAPELAAAPPGGETPPRTPVEAEVAAVFGALLGRERLGVETDFFAAGGHSLLATRAVSRLRDRFGIDLPLLDLFETPTVAGFARRIEALAGSRAPEAPPVRPVPREEPPPLSFAQERLWFLNQLDAGRSPWNLSAAVRFEGRLDLGALEAALNEVVRRHEALRTTFAVAGGRPVQVIAPALHPGLPVVDLAGLPGGCRESELAHWIGGESRRPFDLSTGPLIRALVLRLGREEHAVILTLHHIVSDGWSMGVLIRELGALYEGSPLPALPVQYADFAVWQREWLQGEVLEAELGWWRERLTGAPPLLVLPLDRPRPAVHAFRGRRRRDNLPPALVEALAALARRTGSTLFMTLLAAWKAFLFRVTGEADLLVGTPVANRNRSEIEGLIGFFVNTLVIRTDLSGAPGFLGLIERVREASVGAFAHQDLPFEKLVGELAPERSLQHTPLFQVLFAFESEPPAPPDLPGLRLTPLGAESRTVKFDLTLLARRVEGSLELVLGTNSDLFFATTAERLSEQLRTLIQGATADPGCPIGELPLLSAAERHQLLLGWNDTEEEIPPLPLHRIFEAQAARQPERAAIVAPGETISYGELDRRANRLARRLVGQGVGPEVRVGLLLDRSPELVTALLAVLKAGGAWVPVDPVLPAGRRDFLLADAGATLVISEVDQELDGEDETAPTVDVSPDHLAYVIYTSGSTGVPKGVAVTHRGLASLARAQVEIFGIGPGDRILQFSSPSFDASVSELAVAWAAGAELHLVHREDLLPGASLLALLRERGITNVTLPPSALAVTPWEELPELRSLVVAGEPCPPELAERWSAGRRFVNAYGPTEATVCATAGLYEPGSLRITLGRPIANARVLLLDPRGMEPVPPGVAGEICLAGPGLARGYLGRPDLTAGRFVPHPASGEPGSRLYRTGDLARFLGDGRIELLGRLDEQVKVRGFRVEPGEVRAALLAIPAVREAEVAAPPDPRGERRLVAWVAADPRPTVAELRRLLEDRLPDWLVPSRFVFLEALPKTAGGKVDRRALSLPDEEAGRQAVGRRTPADPVERFLLEIWREVLDLRSLGVEEDFFELGGTSLQAAVLTNLLQERLGDYVYPVALFDAPTIAELARYLERNYPDAVARLRGESVQQDTDAGPPIDDAMVGEIRRVLGTRPRRPALGGSKNPRAVFILSPPRSGSTLLRVMLAGNPRLFAPPELELLGFDTMGERAAELSGRFGLWREGAVRAVMEALGCGLEEAGEILERMEEDDAPVRDLYRRLQEWTAGRTLVDKTPSYSLDRSILERAEEVFEEPLYLHLLRHPYGTIASFEEAKLEQVFFRPAHSFTRRQLAELIWQVSHHNILGFLEGVPAGRQLRVRFEDLVRRPRAELERISAFLGVPFEEGMLDPYAGAEKKMTDGVHAASRMLGDVKFHTHAAVDPGVADRWKAVYRRDFLGESTRRLARGLGFHDGAEPRGGERFSSLVQLRAGGPAPPLFLIHPIGGSAFCYRDLAFQMDADRPIYGLQSVGLSPQHEPHETVEAMAAGYLEEVRRVAPEGPYHLGGWSLGGVVAFEMAQRLAAEGERVGVLALFDSMAPGAVPRTRFDDGQVLQGLAIELGNLVGRSLDVSEQELQGLAGEEGARFLLQRAREAGALPAGFGVDQAVRFWRVVRANTDAIQLYRPEVYPGRLTLFAAEDVDRPDVGPDLGWSRLATGGVELVKIEAGHAALLRGSALRDVTERLRRAMAGAREVSPVIRTP